MYYDVFNGDADGICALHQLRLAEPRPTATAVTGVKRDIRLLHKIRDVHDGDITVLDISMKNNLDDLQRLLNQNCRVLYVDHHFSGTIPDTPALTSHIDPDPEVCTSLIVDHLLAGKYRPWAVAGAFGDNLHNEIDAHCEMANHPRPFTSRDKPVTGPECRYCQPEQKGNLEPVCPPEFGFRDGIEQPDYLLGNKGAKKDDLDAKQNPVRQQRLRETEEQNQRRHNQHRHQ